MGIKQDQECGKGFRKLQTSQENLPNPSTEFSEALEEQRFPAHLDECQRHPGDCDYPKSNYVFCTLAVDCGFPLGFCCLRHSFI